MAASDYRLCDVCRCKVFYDSNLNYENGELPKEDIAREAGVHPGDWGYKLDHLGDWAVICRDCAKTHLTVVIPIN